MCSIRWKNQPIVTICLVVINVIVFLICTFTGEALYNKGELDVFRVISYKEYGRLLYAMFLHTDIMHIFNNMLVLFFLGGMIEKRIGHIWYAVAYFLSGLGGNILSLVVKIANGIIAPSVGASGAVFGLDGVLLAIVLLWRERDDYISPQRVLLMIGLSLYNGFASNTIDNGAHIGGLLVGFLLGAIICFTKKIAGGKSIER